MYPIIRYCKFSLNVTDDKGMVSNNTNNTVIVTVKPAEVSPIANTNIDNVTNISQQESQITAKQQPQLASTLTSMINTTNKLPNS